MNSLEIIIFALAYMAVLWLIARFFGMWVIIAIVIIAIVGGALEYVLGFSEWFQTHWSW